MPRASYPSSGLVLAALLVAAPAGAANLVANPDFATSLAGWSTVSTEPFWLDEDWQGDATGSARIPDQIASTSNNVYLTQCIALDGATELVVQAAIQSTNVGGATGSARIALSFRSALDCNNGSIVPPYTFAIDAPQIVAWTLRSSAPIAPPQGAVAAVLQLVSAKHTDTGGWIADFDAVFVPEPGLATAPTAFAVLALIHERRRRAARRGCRAVHRRWRRADLECAPTEERP